MSSTAAELAVVAEKTLDWVAGARGKQYPFTSADVLRRIELCARAVQDMAHLTTLYGDPHASAPEVREQRSPAGGLPCAEGCPCGSACKSTG